MSSVGFGSAFCFQGLQDIYAEIGRRSGTAFARTVAQAQGKDVNAAVAATEARLKARGKTSIITLIFGDIIQSIPGFAQIGGAIHIAVGVSLLREASTPERRSAYKGYIVRSVIELCNLAPILLITDTIASIALAIIHKKQAHAPA